MKSIKTRIQRRDGFTLIELLIVMACFLIINLTVVGLFNLAVNSDGGRSGAFSLIGQQRTTLDLIAKDIRQAEGIKNNYNGWKSSPDTLIIKSSNSNHLIYSPDTAHPEFLIRTIVDSKGNILPMVLMRNLENIQFAVNHGLVTVKLKTFETRSMDNHIRENNLTIKTRRDL